MTMPSKTFCSDPWNSIFIGTANDVKTCCAGSVVLGDLTKHSLGEILNNDITKEIKQTILNGEWHPNCSQCQHLEAESIRSYRNVECNDELSADLVADPYHFKPRQLDIRWSNICQLACNYCNEYFSSTWANIKKINVGTVKDHYTNTLDWIRQNKCTVKHLLMVGGEPLITKPNVDLLELFKDQEVYASIITSLAVDLDKSLVFNQLKQYKTVSIGLSFDNVGDRYNYVRHNSSWDLLVNNINQVNNMDNIMLNTNPIYSIYNATDLVNFYTFLANNKFSNIHWQRIHYPPELDISRFDAEVKQLAIDEIDRLLLQFKDTDFVKSDLDFFRNMRQFLIESVPDNSATQDFVKFTDNLENNQLPGKAYTFFELWPEFNFLKDVQ